MEYCIVGLGNPGKEYENTRHNIGFRTIDTIANTEHLSFSKSKIAYYTRFKYEEHTIYLLKPLLYMNRSGEAVVCWTKKLELPLSQLLVITDDLHLPLGRMRLRPSGGSGGHNGLKDITARLGSHLYPRLRLGIGKNYLDGQQSNYVLAPFQKSEQKEVDKSIQLAVETVFSFCRAGINITMSQYN